MKKLLLLSLVFLIFLNPIKAQTNDYPLEFTAYKFRDVSASEFDNGIILTGYKLNEYDNSSFGYGIVKKLDVNGNTLWEKLIGVVPPPGLTTTWNISQTADGGYIIVGAYLDIVYNADIFAMKLDACGEKEWQQIFHSYSSQSIHNIYELEDGAFLMQVDQWELYDDPNKRIWVFKLAPNGDVIWKKHYADYDPWPASGESVWEFIPDNTGNFVMSGSYYKRQPGYDTNTVYLRPFFLKIDTAGNEVWHNIMGIPDFFKGDNFGADALNSGSVYAGCDARTPPYDRSALNKVYANGQTAFKKDLNNEWGRAEDVSIMADTAIYITLYTYDHLTDSAKNYVYHVDTLGNIVNTRLFDDSGTNYYVKNSTITKDNKYVLVSYTPVSNSDHWTSYLWKFKSNLEYDSLYTQPQIYDSLCPYPITNDTIPLDTTLVINLEHLWNNLKPMSIFPNPVSDKLNISINIIKWEERILKVSNLSGTEVFNDKILPGKAKHTIDVSTWKPGIYIFSLYEKGSLLQTEKVVKM